MFWQHYLCYDVIKTMLFVIMAASFVLSGVQISLFWQCYLYYDVAKTAFCYLFQYYILQCYWTGLCLLQYCWSNTTCCSVAKEVLSSYNVTDSRCSGFKIMGSMLFVSENWQSNTVLLEYHWSKVILYVVLAICPYIMLLNQTHRYSYGCYLV